MSFIFLFPWVSRNCCFVIIVLWFLLHLFFGVSIQKWECFFQSIFELDFVLDISMILIVQVLDNFQKSFVGSLRDILQLLCLILYSFSFLRVYVCALLKHGVLFIHGVLLNQMVWWEGTTPPTFTNHLTNFSLQTFHLLHEHCGTFDHLV